MVAIAGKSSSSALIHLHRCGNGFSRPRKVSKCQSEADSCSNYFFCSCALSNLSLRLQWLIINAFCSLFTGLLAPPCEVTSRRSSPLSFDSQHPLHGTPLLAVFCFAFVNWPRSPNYVSASRPLRLRTATSTKGWIDCFFEQSPWASVATVRGWSRCVVSHFGHWHFDDCHVVVVQKKVTADIDTMGVKSRLSWKSNRQDAAAHKTARWLASISLVIQSKPIIIQISNINSPTPP